MNGHVDGSGRALVRVVLRSESGSEDESDVWIDTGFTGDLVLPQPVIDRLGLVESGSVDAILADGTEVTLPTYTCLLDWFGVDRRLEVVANSGAHPLLGVGLLLGLELRVNYRSLELTVEPARGGTTMRANFHRSTTPAPRLIARRRTTPRRHRRRAGPPRSPAV